MFSPLSSGTSLKAGVRFVSYDHFKSRLADAEVRLPSIRFRAIYLTLFRNVSQGKVSAPRSLLGTLLSFATVIV